MTQVTVVDDLFGTHSLVGRGFWSLGVVVFAVLGVVVLCAWVAAVVSRVVEGRAL